MDCSVPQELRKTIFECNNIRRIGEKSNARKTEPCVTFIIFNLQP